MGREELRKKVLCLCKGGVCRSVTLAALLKYWWPGNMDVLAASLEKNSASTLDMLYKWADTIVVADESLLLEVPTEYAGQQLLLANLGEDRWGMSMHPDLIPVAWAELRRLFGPPKGEATLEKVFQKSEKYVRRREAYGDRSVG